jgi:uncharacterized protein
MNSLEQALFNAVEDGDSDKVAHLLARGVNVDARDRDGVTPLIRSAVHGYLSITKKLLSSGADVDARSKRYGHTALHSAAREQRLAVVKALLKAGADPNAQDEDLNTPLWGAIYSARNETSLRILDALVDAGASRTIKNRAGHTPARLAADLEIRLPSRKNKAA